MKIKAIFIHFISYNYRKYIPIDMKNVFQGARINWKIGSTIALIRDFKPNGPGRKQIILELKESKKVHLWITLD